MTTMELMPESVPSRTGTGQVALRAGSGKSMAVAAAMLGAMSATGASAPLAEPLSLIRVFVGTSTSRISTTITSRESTSEPEGTTDATVALSADISETLSDSDAVNWIKAQSGLTWDQLGKVFGVSRRAVHLWAGGGRMNATNARILREFAAAVQAVRAPDPATARAALLAVGTDGMSVVDRFRSAQASRTEDISGTPFKPEELLGALHDEVNPGT